MNYWFLPESGIPVSSTTVHRITQFECGLEINKDKLKEFDMKVSDNFRNSRSSADRSISPEEWKELVDNDEAFTEYFEKVFDNLDVNDSDDFSPDTFYGYFNMEISMDHGGEEQQIAKFVKQMKDNEGNSIGMSNKNPILDTGVYEIEFQNGFLKPVAANTIAKSLFAQVDQEGRRHNIFDMIIDIRKTDKAVKGGDEFDIS